MKKFKKELKKMRFDIIGLILLIAIFTAGMTMRLNSYCVAEGKTTKCAYHVNFDFGDRE